MRLTFVRSVHSHVVDVVKLAMESCLEIRIWGKHALRFGIDEFVNPRLRTTGQNAKTLRAKRIRARVGFTPVYRGGTTTHDDVKENA